jgi:hypothetical protein
MRRVITLGAGSRQREGVRLSIHGMFGLDGRISKQLSCTGSDAISNTAVDFARDAMTPQLTMWNRVDLTTPPKGLRTWLGRASEVSWREHPDAHLRFVQHYDDPQHGDPARTQRYLDALAFVRARADTGEAPNLVMFSTMQGCLHGLAEPTPLRTTDAFGRGGAHCYPVVEGFEEMLNARMAVWTNTVVDPFVRATALYLDVIFTHPFDDGNARAARLGYEWVLRHAGRMSPRMEDLLRLQKIPGDVDGFWRMVRLGAASSVGSTKLRCSRDDGP